MLARIEPTAAPGYDIRTFECPTCGQVDTQQVAYK